MRYLGLDTSSTAFSNAQNYKKKTVRISAINSPQRKRVPRLLHSDLSISKNEKTCKEPTLGQMNLLPIRTQVVDLSKHKQKFAEIVMFRHPPFFSHFNEIITYNE